MNKKILTCILSLLPMTATAAIPYRVEQVRTPVVTSPSGYDASSYAREHRFYIGGSYNFSMWDGYTDNADITIGGKNSSGFDVSLGVRPYDIFRIEANYIRTNAEWNAFSIKTNMAMLNMIFDARIDNLYRLFRTQKIVPYVGFGAGASWNSSDDVYVGKRVTPVAAALAGVGVELGGTVALDFGYKYLYVFSPELDAVSDLNPTAHQFRAGMRINF